jgi:chorismate-pyruvate lyase
MDSKVIKKYPDKQLLKALSTFQRVLLITDGTVTELLEQYLDEPIKVVKLYEKIEQDLNQLSVFHQQFIPAEESVFLKRKTLLQGQQTLNNWLYAESVVLINNLEADFRVDLLDSHEPIGKLWSKYRYETYKVIVAAGEELTGELATHFNISPNDKMITRTYTVFSNNKIIMIITEKFPHQFFRGE